MPKPPKPLQDAEATHNYLLWLLSRKDYPVADLMRKMKRRGLTTEAAETALKKITDLGIYDPKSYTQARLRGLVRKGIAGHALTGRLRSKGVEVDKETVGRAYEETSMTLDKQLDELWDKEARRGLPRGETLSREERAKTKQKLFRKFASKGHSFDAVQKRLKKHGY